MSPPAPWPPLVAGGDGLDAYPDGAPALAARMAAVYGVAPSQVLPVRGATHGLELAWRLARRDGGAVEAPAGAPYDRLGCVYGVGQGPAAAIVRREGPPDAVAEQARAVAPALLVVDEGRIEFEETPSAASLLDDHANLVVLRSLSLAYGLAGARVGAALARPETLARLADVMEPHALPAPSARLALQALDPSRQIETAARIDAVRRERARLVAAGAGLRAEAGPRVSAGAFDTPSLDRLGVPYERDGERLVLPVSLDPGANDRLLAALGVPVAAVARRTGEAVRDTRETRIVCAVDLDAAGPTAIHTGVGFFDHMLEQVSAHGGFALRLTCEGDLQTDPHHTVEDSAIALGQALRRALGDRRGIGRYGFVAPMDEALARVSIDLSGRPYAVFEGDFATPFIGAYRTDLTAHVVRSLAESLGAAIHVTVTGDDDHHKTEAVFKGLGRALRQAIRIEGGDVPSTKGVL